MGRDPKSWIRRVVCLALMGGIGAPISAEVKIEEQVVGPLDGVVGFVVSAKGVHYAASTLQGSRSVLVVDGVESPKFDEPPPPPVFSADGAH